VYNIPCDGGRCYIGETSRPLEVRIKEHKYNLTQGLLEKSKLAQHACEEEHKICWKEAKVLQIEPNTTYTYRKYKESAHMSLIDHPISQPSLDISPIWTPIIAKSRNYNSVKSKLRGKIVFLCRYHTRIYDCSDDIYSDSNLVLGLLRVESLLMFLMFVLTLTDGLCCA
jgi:predicted GIY-YIG superfamily endonuclease